MSFARTSLLASFVSGPELLIVLGVIVLLFGSSQIPKLARSITQARNEFTKASNEGAPSSGGSQPPKNNA